MMLVRIAFSVFRGITVMLNSAHDIGGACEGVIRGILGACPESGVSVADTVDILGVFPANQVVYVEGTAKMNINRIPFKCPVQIVVTAASDVADFFKVAPISYRMEASDSPYWLAVLLLGTITAMGRVLATSSSTHSLVRRLLTIPSAGGVSVSSTSSAFTASWL